MITWLKRLFKRKRGDDWRLRETWEDYPAPQYNKKHTYCSIVFEGSERIYYYRTRNPDIKVGTLVYVPFGSKYEKRIGRVVAMKSYRGKRVPYPLEKTKHISGIAEE